MPNIYTKELVDNLHFEFYTKNEHFRKALGISPNTASKYLRLLEEKGFLISEKIGKEIIYKNVALFNLMDKR